jgi:hypothetical protein
VQDWLEDILSEEKQVKATVEDTEDGRKPSE